MRGFVPTLVGKRAVSAARPWKLVVDGDSNTDHDRFEYNWWRMLKAKMAGTNVLVGENFAVAGDRWSHMIDRQYRIQAARDARYRCCLLIAIATNNFNGGNETVAEVTAWAQTYLANAVGWDAIGMIAIPPLSNNSTKDSRVNTWNAALLTLPRVTLSITREHIPELSDSGDRTYFVDYLHYSELGCELLSDNVRNQLGAKLGL